MLFEEGSVLIDVSQEGEQFCMTRQQRHVTAAAPDLFPILAHPPGEASLPQETSNSGRRRLAALLVLLTGAVLPPLITAVAPKVAPRTATSISRPIVTASIRREFTSTAAIACG